MNTDGSDSTHPKRPASIELKTFDKIAADAASLAFTETSSRSTIQGIGSDSGRWIMGVGKILIRGMEWVLVRRRFQSIEASLKVNEGVDLYPSVDICKDLLELQRVGLYPLEVRSQAWRMILFILGSELGAAQIVECIRCWPVVEIQLFIRQLAVAKLSGWTLYPGANEYNSPSFLDRTAEPISLRQRNLTQGFDFIIHHIVFDNAALLHEIYDMNEFTGLQTSRSSPGEEGNDAIIRFLTSLALEFDDAPTNTNSSLPKHAVAMAQFIATGPEDYPSRWVDILARALRAYATDAKDVASVWEMDPALRSRDVPYPFLPFLIFTLYLAYLSRHASRLFLHAGLLQTTAALFRLAQPQFWLSVTADTTFGSENYVYSACLHIFATLAYHCSADDCASELTSKRSVELGLDRWAISMAYRDPDFFRVIPFSTSPLEMSINFRNEFRSLALRVLETIALQSERYDAEKWHVQFMSSFLTLDAHDLPSRKTFVARISLHCIASPEDCWADLIGFLQRSKQQQCHMMLHAIITFLQDTLRLSPTSDHSELLRSLQKRSSAHGVIVTNPVDRFLILVMRAGGDELGVFQYFNDAGGLRIVRDTLRGCYDYIGDPPTLNPEQREKREYICHWLQENCKTLRGIVPQQGVLTELPF